MAQPAAKAEMGADAYAPSAPAAPAPGAPAPAVAGAAREVALARTAAPPPAAPPPAPPPSGAPTPVVAARTDAKATTGAVVAQPAPEPAGTEQYTDYGVNPFVDPTKDPLSTFAIDVDTASYAISRSKLQSGSLPPFASVRAEEFINYFNYDYTAPQSDPFAVHLAAAPSPYDAGHHILRVGLQAKRVSKAQRTAVHLVYLVDTSGSMQSADKIGLAKKALKLLTAELKPGDTVALCTYAGSVREVLPPTGANEQQTILRAIDDLVASGSTAMASGLDLAYQLAQRTLVKGHINRVIVLSDGDANVGAASHQQILERIGRYKDLGITLSTIGFGRGNYKDTMMEQLANQGDGNYAYIDSEAEARKVFVDQLEGTLEVVARDVKIQVEFDPKVVARYRLIGYENRDVADKDFRNDAVDAGEIGAGHNVTALYDVVLAKAPEPGRAPVIVRLRHKPPLGSNTATEQLVKLRPEDMAATFAAAPASLRLATAVAGFAEILRQSPYARSWSLDTVATLARAAAWGTPEQTELQSLIATAKRLVPAPSPPPPAAVIAK
jgi:Ca-activated chloride channel family protein